MTLMVIDDNEDDDGNNGGGGGGSSVGRVLQGYIFLMGSLLPAQDKRKSSVFAGCLNHCYEFVSSLTTQIAIKETI